MQAITIGGNALHYCRTGRIKAKRAVVFINSLGTDMRIWDAVVAGLGEGWQSVRYDKRGHGLSDVGAAPYTMADHADDLSGLLDHLGLKDAIVCGVSVGGQIAQELYARRPDLVAGMVLCATAAKIGEPEFWHQRISVIEKNGLASMTDSIMERWLSPAYRSADNPNYQLARNMFERQPVAGYLGTCAAIAGFDRRTDAAAISVPVAVVAGALDGATPPELVRAFAGAIPGASFTLVDGVGHLPCIEAPETVCTAISEIAERLTTRDTQ